MFRLDFKAKVISASKNSRDNYYMVGLADDMYNYKNYIIFQRPIQLDPDDDPNADMNGIYAECNNDVCYNGVKSAKLMKESLSFEIQDSIINIDITEVKINKRFMNYLQNILGDLLVVEQ